MSDKPEFHMLIKKRKNHWFLILFSISLLVLVNSNGWSVNVKNEIIIPWHVMLHGEGRALRK